MKVSEKGKKQEDEDCKEHLLFTMLEAIIA
jgi:hypothetical protein